MTGKEKLLSKCTVEELDREVAARGMRTPAAERFEGSAQQNTRGEEDTPEPVRELDDDAASFVPRAELRRISNWELARALVLDAWDARAVWEFDDRTDIYKIEDNEIKENAKCVAAVCLGGNLEEQEDEEGYHHLELRSYRTSVGVSKRERFWNQPVFAGKMCTGFLVKDDIIATAAHIADEKNVTSLKIVFGFTMRNARTPVTRIPKGDIYRGVELIKKRYIHQSGQPDWALVRLDRSVTGRKPAKPAKGKLYRGQPVYTIGHPRGLPLKAAPGANISHFNKHCFLSDLDIYSGNSGSPVFCGDTHQVVGMVVRGEDRDYKETRRGLVSMVYPNFEVRPWGTQSTRVSEFIMYCL